MFQRVLIANRGEIALRILRACRDLGISPVAVYSEADAKALHVTYADAAYCIGPAPARESYLVIERIIEVAKRSGAEAVHPGYGFLSENATFAEACAAAGLVFIGPPPAAMRLMGDKVAARRTMQKAGVPVVPGTDLIRDAEAARAAARAIGLPVLVKAAAGGGGKGIRIVRTLEELDRALDLAASEAQAAFGNAGVYIEKYLAPVRHIEVQVMADAYGTVVALGERECSIQRRHQKLIEESPSVAVTPALREQLGAAAVAAARAVGYRNAGTVEFLLDRDGAFYFLEMNTRLQVEHPVTEMVTGLDLVVDQIKVAAGEPLSYRQEDIVLRGHAIECRITAEDPANNFFPSSGTISALRQPAGPGVRVDSELFSGADVSLYYDPLVAKLIAWGRDRQEAISRLQRALREYIIAGVHTNIPLHRQILADPRFVAGEIHTQFLEQEFSYQAQPPDEERTAALIAAALLARTRRPVAVAAGSANGALSYWRSAARASALRVWSGGWQRNSA